MDAARIDRKRAHAVRGGQFIEVQRKQRVGRLGLRIRCPFVVFAMIEVDVVEIEAIARVAGRRQRHNPRFSSHKQRPQPRGHLEMAQVIGRELAFEATGIARQRAGHDRGVGDEDVERWNQCGDLAGKPIDRGGIGKVELENRHVARHIAQIGGCGIGTSGPDDHPGPGPGQRADGFKPEPGIAARNQRNLARQVAPLDHFGGARTITERRSERGLGRGHSAFLELFAPSMPPRPTSGKRPIR